MVCSNCNVDHDAEILESVRSELKQTENLLKQTCLNAYSKILHLLKQNPAICTAKGGRGFLSLDPVSDLSLIPFGSLEAKSVTVLRKIGGGEYTADFLQFWKAYPRKKNKGDAAKAFLQAGAALQDLLTAIAWQAESKDWTKDGGQFIPYPASYLRARGWEDEPSESSELVAERARKTTILDAMRISNERKANGA